LEAAELMPERISLDIPESQVLVNFPNDAIPWHHRVLLFRIEGSKWVVLTPDGDIQVIDLKSRDLRALSRNSPIPRGLGGSYVFDPIDAEKLVAVRAEARRLAAALGGTVAVEETVGESTAVWRFADTASPRFGQEVSGDLLGVADRFKVGGASGLVCVDMAEDTWEFVQRVLETDHQEWLDEKRSGAGRDMRLGTTVRDTSGARTTTLREAWPDLKREESIPGWLFEGPRAGCELAPAVLATGHEMLTYGPHWIQASGLNPHSGLAVEFSVLIMVWHFAVVFDQLNPRNIACMELVARRILMIQKAVKRNCKAPDFEGLEIYLSHRFDASGGVVSRSFDKHISALQRDEAQIMKQTRLWHEEVDAKAKTKAGPKGGKNGKNGGAGPAGESPP
jgi:hypothetical protein